MTALELRCPDPTASDWRFETQVTTATLERLVGESGRLVSLLLTDEEICHNHLVDRTDREGIYDGVVWLAPHWIFVIENKPDSRNVWLEQLSSQVSETFEIEPTPIILRWCDILFELSALASSGECDEVSKCLIMDFLEFVGEYFPELKPYRTLRICDGHEVLLKKRCIDLMEELGRGAVERHFGWLDRVLLTGKPGVKMAALRPIWNRCDEWFLQLELHPGDSMQQARRFYGTVDIERVAELRSRWAITPNFHVAFRASNLVHENSPHLDVLEYVKYWQEQVALGRLSQLPRHAWERSFNEWLAKLIVSKETKAHLDALNERGYQVLNVCPGVSFRRRISRDEALGLDDQPGALAAAINAAIEEAVTVW